MAIKVADQKLLVRPRWSGLYRMWTIEQKLQIARVLNFEPHPAQLDIIASPARFRVVICGRRFGKSLLSSFEAICCAALGGWVMVVGPTYTTANIVFREAGRMVLNSEFRRLVTRFTRSQGMQEIEFSSGGRIFVRTSENPSSLLGEGLDLCVFDEAAEETDEGIFSDHIRPALLDREGAAIFPTTPEGDTWIKDYFERGQDAKYRQQGWMSWQLPSATNPHLPRRVLELDRQESTLATWNQEYLAQFLDSAGAVFKGFRSVCTLRPLDGPEPGRRYAIGVDWAKFEDYTVATVVDVFSGQVVCVERYEQGLEYDVYTALVADLSRRWGAAPILCDSTGLGDPITDKLAQDAPWAAVEGYVFTNVSKTHLINQLALAIERGEFWMLDRDPDKEHDIGTIVQREFGSYRYSKSDSGTIKMGAPEGRHDDCVISHALALEACRRLVGGAPSLPPPRESRPSIAGAYGRRKR